MILQCQCEHQYQDKMYGRYFRVHNPCVKGYRCTVCGKVVGSGKEVTQKEPEK